MVSLAEWATDHPHRCSVPSEIAQSLARMALRLDDAELLARGARLHRESLGGRDAPVYAARGRWLAGIADGDLQAVEDAASTFEGLGRLPDAVDAWADAAILAARAGLGPTPPAAPPDYASRWVCIRCSGQLPETRWMGADVTARAARSHHG